MIETVWSYGGGTQSCAIAVLVARGDLPTPDCVVIADTGREASETWAYLDEHIRPLLAPLEVHVAPKTLATRLYEATGVRWRHTGTFMDHSAFVTDEQPPEEFEVTIPWTEPSAEWVTLVNRSRGKIIKSRTRGKTRYIIRGGYTGGVVGRFDTEAEARAYIEKAKAALEEVV